ncbi:UPF0149 family protein [Pseudomonas sp. UBA4194]|uniref:UPF0149 family protein n=1 Tax=Pseudomonas sp. UBA4194 TaxID=1947317 RepID=UPI0025CF51EA|nr:UPF0149 family protein [Pseudomonas sp. UBA4194]
MTPIEHTMAYTPISDDALTDEQLDYVEEVLGKYASETSVGSISELDGFFAAIVSGPQAIAFSDWYAALWGGADKLPVFEDDKQFEKFFELLIQHMNQLAMLLQEDFENFAPIFNLFDDEEVVSVEDWCFGYERGVVVGGSWLDMPDEEQDLLALITLHTQGVDLLKPDGSGAELDAEQAMEMIQMAAIRLHQYWLERRPSTTPVVNEVKTGRNDPCPCGSGKKFKQCCLH